MQHQAPASTAHSCKNCGHNFNGNYCNNCGEKVYTSHDKSMLHFLEEGLHFITHFEGSFFRTIGTVFSRPGKLSNDYCNGIRKKYFKPLSFFLLLVVLYLLFPLFPGLSMQLRYHMAQFPYASMAKNFVAHYMQQHPGVTFQQLSEMFAVKSEKTAKMLLFVIIPLTALPLWLFYRRQRPYFFDSLILATEFSSVYLVITFFIVPLLVSTWYWLSQVIHIPYTENELPTAITSYAALVIYLNKEIRLFFKTTPVKRWLSVLVVIIWQMISVYIIYKFLLFLLVFMQLH